MDGFQETSGTAVPDAAAVEAADETFLIAWRRFDDIPAGRERAWLYGVARKVLGNQYRGARRRQQLDARLAGTTAAFVGGPEVDVIRSEDDRRLWHADLRLRPADQEVLRLAVWEDLAHAQIGVALGCGAIAARQRLHRALARLARELERAERPVPARRVSNHHG